MWMPILVKDISGSQPLALPRPLLMRMNVIQRVNCLGSPESTERAEACLQDQQISELEDKWAADLNTHERSVQLLKEEKARLKRNPQAFCMPFLLIFAALEIVNKAMLYSFRRQFNKCAHYQSARLG